MTEIGGGALFLQDFDAPNAPSPETTILNTILMTERERERERERGLFF